MAGKFAKISRLEWVTLLLTACFAAAGPSSCFTSVPRRAR